MNFHRILSDLRKINSQNFYHSRIVLYILYLEKIFSVKFPFKILRRLIIQHGYLCEISPDSFVSPDHIVTLRLPHPFLIIIHRTATIGAHCTIFHNVTIGVLENSPYGLEAGNIGNNVYIGCDSTILGKVTIGDNVKIGAKSLIFKDVQSTQTVTGLYK